MKTNNENIKYVSVVIVVNDISYLNESLNSVFCQNCNEKQDLYFIISQDIDYIIIREVIRNILITKNLNLKYKIIKKVNKFISKNQFIDLFESIRSEYIILFNGEDINDKNRFKKQINFMNNNREYEICSCMEGILPIDKADVKIFEHDNFKKSSEIDNSILGGYVPLDLYSFIIRKSFFELLLNLFDEKLYTELDYILYFLRYTSIEKIPEVLYYVRNFRIPYKECVNIDYSFRSLNKVSIFNRNRYIERRSYLRELLASDKEEKYIIADKSKNTNNILIIIQNLNIGGTETYILNLIKYLRKLNIDTCIITNGGAEEPFRINKIKLYTLKAVNYSIEKKLNFIKSVIEENNIKIICCHSDVDIKICREASLKFNIPWILTLHGTFYDSREFEKKEGKPNEIIAVSSMVKKYYLKNAPALYETEIKVIYNGVECNKVYDKGYLKNIINLPNDKKIIIYCSRLSSGKAPLAVMFLKSFKKLAKKYDDLYAVILGDGNKKIVIDSYIKEINKEFKENRAFSIGAVYDVEKYYTDSLFIVGTGRTALEAMSVSKPVLALGLIGYFGIINKTNIDKNKENNFGDHSDAEPQNLSLAQNELTSSMELLIKDETYRKNIGEDCREYCEKNFNIGYMADKISEIYRKYF